MVGVVTQELREVALLAGRSALQELLPRVLDALSAVIVSDMSAVLELQGDELVVICAQGPLATAAVRRHRIPLRPNTGVQRAIQDKRAKVITEQEHAQGEDPYHGLVDLVDGHSCMVVPLVADDRTLGVMTFDRQRCGVYGPDVVDIATIYGQIIALSMAAATRLERENVRLEARADALAAEVGGSDAAVRQLEATQTPGMKEVVDLAYTVARTDATVLIVGETGVGKEVLARAIHAWSERAAAPFVKVNCAALPEGLVESELFGHLEGAFSGATRRRAGRFVAADGGTILLDEIGDMPLGVQTKLLRVLQERILEPVGSDESIEVDVRMLASTHVDLARAMEEGRFREDLYYRLATFPLEIPPLRDRPDDVLSITRSFLQEHARQSGRGPWDLSRDAGEALVAHAWPGNVRELVNVLERATILRSHGVIEPDDLWAAPSLGSRAKTRIRTASAHPAWLTLEEHERRYLEEVLVHTGGKIYGTGGAAEILDVKPSTLQSRMKRLGVRRPG